MTSIRKEVRELITISEEIQSGLMTGECLTEDGKAPFDFADVTVCWSDGYSFGVKFPPMTAVNRQRVQELILKFVTLRWTSQRHTAFRLV